MFGVPFAHCTIWPAVPLSRRIAELLNFPLALPATPRYWPTPPWACSSVVEHCVDIAGVASSILATPTIENPVKLMVWRGFCFPGADCCLSLTTGIFGKFWANCPPLLANSGHASAGPWQPIPESRSLLKRREAEAANGPSLKQNQAHMAALQRPPCLCLPSTSIGSRCADAKRKAFGLVRARAPPRGYGRMAYCLATICPSSA